LAGAVLCLAGAVLCLAGAVLCRAAGAVTTVTSRADCLIDQPLIVCLKGD
jgi:hypothetical protein